MTDDEHLLRLPAEPINLDDPFDDVIGFEQPSFRVRFLPEVDAATVLDAVVKHLTNTRDDLLQVEEAVGDLAERVTQESARRTAPDGRPDPALAREIPLHESSSSSGTFRDSRTLREGTAQRRGFQAAPL